MTSLAKKKRQWAAAVGESRHARPILAIGGISLAAVSIVLVLTAPALLLPLLICLVAVAWLSSESSQGLQIDQIDRLRQAELSLAGVQTTEAAARELAEHAIALLDAPSAVVLIEGIGDTVRVGAGDASGQRVYGDGSRMRLLDDDGVPCGSIAVSARADGKPYNDRDERILDALAQRVSSSLHRLSLFAEIQEERKTLSDVLTSSSDGIFSTGPDHRIRSWNPAMERITGVRASDALGEQSATIFRPVDEQGEPRFGKSDPGRPGEAVEGLVVSTSRTDEAEPRWLTCSWSPLSEGGYVVVARDETERKKLQDDKDGWIAQVSHELRTPLTPIKGFLHTLARRDEQLSASDRQRIYDVMLREQQRLEDLVNSLLQATNLDADHVVVPEVVDWASIVYDQATLYARQDLTRELDARIPDDLPSVVADANLATGVLANLLSNALKYGDPASPIVVTVTRQDDEVVTTVTDGGPGVPVSDRERVFEKFTRLGDHLTRPQQGVGLGLYIARRSVEQLGGDIWIDDGEGGGAAFSFSLPVHRGSSPVGQPAAPGEGSDRPEAETPA